VSVAIETVELTRSFDTGVALDHLTMSLGEGEVLALLGPNGAGKTTTVRLLNGVLRPNEGSCRVLDLDPVKDGEELRRHTGVLTENAGLDDRLTARENLVYTGRIRGLGRTEADRRTDELLERFGMAEKADHLTVGFSTGERKRVALARALLHRPSVLFLDEPTSGLDPAATRDVQALITTLANDEGRTIVLATHFLGEAGRLADRMAVLHRGSLEAFGRPDDLARELWPGFDALIDLGGPVRPETLTELRSMSGVHWVEPSDSGCRAHVADREVVPRLVNVLVGGGYLVYAAEPRAPTLEDVYFEIEARTGARSTEIDAVRLLDGAPS
jgi:ABC-2 type transport system ATP-binding protein